jgi:hypothetical protein
MNMKGYGRKLTILRSSSNPLKLRKPQKLMIGMDLLWPGLKSGLLNVRHEL